MMTLDGDTRDGAEWTAILDHLVRNMDGLVDDFIGRLSEIGSYRAEDITADDLRVTAADTLTMLIDNLAGRVLRPEQRELPERLGVRRARQGVGRDDLLEAVRLDFRVLWSGLVTASREAGVPSDMIVRHAEEVLSVVEQYIGDVQVAFLNERALLVRDRTRDATRAFARLMATTEPTTALAEEAARLAHVPVHAEFEVAFVPVVYRDLATSRLADAAGRREHLVWDAPSGVAVVRPVRAGGPDWRTDLSGISGGFVRAADGLIAVPSAIRAAATLAAIGDRHPGILIDADLGWLEIAHRAMGDRLPDFTWALRAALDTLDVGERTVILDTVWAFARTGSIKETAAVLFCHRNTVVNRLRVFERLTGLDITVPVDAARALLCLDPETAEPTRLK